jgi:hypothetical protein
MANGNNTLYTVPAGKTAFMVMSYFSFQAQLFFSNNSTASRNYRAYVVPNGGSAGTTNLSLQTTAFADKLCTGYNSTHNLQAGDSIVVDTNNSTAGQHAWVFVIEI